jgi:hypothetical protein
MIAYPLPDAMAELYACACLTGELTVADRYGIQAILMSPFLNEEDKRCIDRLIHAVRRGRIRISETLSVITTKNHYD